MGYVVADATFYILFYQELEEQDSLHHILNKFEMCVGEEIKRELKNHIAKDNKFMSLVKDVTTDINFVYLLEDFYAHILREFPQLSVRITKGEYEAMGLSYLLKQYNTLKYLIMDDKRAHNFVEKQLVTLKPHLIRTPKFLYIACSEDKLLKKEFVVRIYHNIKQAIIKGKKPLYLTEASWEVYVKPLLIAINGGQNNG